MVTWFVGLVMMVPVVARWSSDCCCIIYRMWMWVCATDAMMDAAVVVELPVGASGGFVSS